MPAVSTFCQCEILLIPPHFQRVGACNDSVLAGVQSVICLSVSPTSECVGVLCTDFCNIKTVDITVHSLAMQWNTDIKCCILLIKPDCPWSSNSGHLTDLVLQRAWFILQHAVSLWELTGVKPGYGGYEMWNATLAHSTTTKLKYVNVIEAWSNQGRLHSNHCDQSKWNQDFFRFQGVNSHAMLVWLLRCHFAWWNVLHFSLRLSFTCTSGQNVISGSTFCHPKRNQQHFT